MMPLAVFWKAPDLEMVRFPPLMLTMPELLTPPAPTMVPLPESVPVLLRADAPPIDPPLRLSVPPTLTAPLTVMLEPKGTGTNGPMGPAPSIFNPPALSVKLPEVKLIAAAGA